MDATTQPVSRVQTFNVGVRRLMLIVGLGVVAAVGGAVITGELNVRLAPKLIGAPKFVAAIVGAIVWRFWVLAVLPGIGYVTGRALRLGPLSLAFGAALSGELLYVALDFVRGGLAGLSPNVGVTAIRVGTLAAGILLTLRATRAGIRAADRAQLQATQRARAKKDEYAEFLRAAERAADRQPAGSAAVTLEPSTTKVAATGEPTTVLDAQAAQVGASPEPLGAGEVRSAAELVASAAGSSEAPAPARTSPSETAAASDARPTSEPAKP